MTGMSGGRCGNGASVELKVELEIEILGDGSM